IVADLVGEIDVNGGGRFPRGIIVFLMQRYGEDIAGVGVADLCEDTRVQHRRSARRKGIAGDAHAREDRSGPLAMVHVAVECTGGRYSVTARQAAEGTRHVVDHAESLAMIREGVVEASPDVEGDLIA